MRFLFGLFLINLVILMGCSKPPAATEQTGASLSPEARLEQIPDADPKKYAGTTTWGNPYLIIKVDGVALVDAANNEEHLLKTDELVAALAKLPPSAWPYGRVVAITENAVLAKGDDVLIRKNRGIVAGTLEGLHVLINWIPSA